MNQEQKKFERRLYELLKDYHHYKYMSSGLLGAFRGWGKGMNLCDFMEWLNSNGDRE